MSIKKAALVAVALVAAALLFAVVYGMFSRGSSVSSVGKTEEKSASQADLAQPVTPDSAASEIEGQSQTDATAFDTAESAELSDIDSTDAEVTAINNDYDENNIQ